MGGWCSRCRGKIGKDRRVNSGQGQLKEGHIECGVGMARAARSRENLDAFLRRDQTKSLGDLGGGGAAGGSHR